MTDAELVRLLLAAALPAPFAFRLAAAVRDAANIWSEASFAAIAALLCFLSGSLLLAVSAALAPVLLLAHARFLGAHRAPLSAAGERTAAAADMEAATPDSPPPDPLHAGMACIGDLLESADRLGELKHQRRLRKIERLQAERAAAASIQEAQPARPPERYLRVRAKRDPLRLPPPK